MKNLCKIIATGCLSGLFPFAPGTAGSIVVFTLWALSCSIVTFSPLSYLVLTVSTLFAGERATAYYTESQGGHRSDPSEVVIDEWAGFLASVTIISFFSTPTVFPTGLSVLVLFRVLDIAKPWPVSYFDKIHTSWGVMLDDVVAGLIAGTVVGVCAYFA